MIRNESILNASYTIQLWESFLEGLVSTLRVMLKSNLGAIFHIKSGMTSKLSLTPYDIFP